MGFLFLPLPGLCGLCSSSLPPDMAEIASISEQTCIRLTSILSQGKFGRAVHDMRSDTNFLAGIANADRTICYA